MRHLALVALIPSLAFAVGDTFFVESFEAPVARVDAGGVWTEIYLDAANLAQGPAVAHRGAAGLSVSRQVAQLGNGTDTQLEWVSGESSRGNSWLRWWMRTRVSSPAPQAIIGFGDTDIPNQLAVAHDPAGLFVTGFDDTGTFFNPRASDLLDAGWHLYELSIRGMGFRDGGVTLVIDGAQVLEQRTPFDFPDAGVRQVNVGLTYGEPRSLLGAIDYDDVRGSIERPAGMVRVTGVNGPWYAGTCVKLRVDFTTSDRNVQRPLFDANALTFSVTPPATFYVDDQCGALVGVPFIAPAGTNVVDLWFAPPIAGNYVITAAADDLLTGQGIVSVQPAMADAGRPDAGFVSDAGAGDAGIADAGGDDAGGDDAGTVSDAGEADAGRIDAGSDGGSSLVSDAGNATSDGPRELTVGCGCDAAMGSWWFAMILLARSRQRRPGQQLR